MLSFLSVLKDDATKIKNETKLLIAADKTTNFYKLEPSETKAACPKNLDMKAKALYAKELYLTADNTVSAFWASLVQC